MFLLDVISPVNSVPKIAIPIIAISAVILIVLLILKKK